jgi:hypothetical protein
MVNQKNWDETRKLQYVLLMTGNCLICQNYTWGLFWQGTSPPSPFGPPT